MRDACSSARRSDCSSRKSGCGRRWRCSSPAAAPEARGKAMPRQPNPLPASPEAAAAESIVSHAAQRDPSRVHETLRREEPTLQTFKALALSGIFPTSIPNVASDDVFAAQMRALAVRCSTQRGPGGAAEACLHDLDDDDDAWRCNTALWRAF
mmetsp:Transcript_90877/g.272920  ORF Transcript_90877/g.272920 Transcript_90877/m.272920 type:complete len:153 (+) Transcript_90877:396-854(+)